MRNLLLVIDMQNDFIGGALGTPEAAAIVDRVVEEIGRYPAEDIIATRDTHETNYLDTRVTAALRGAVVIDKPAFGSKELAERLAGLARQEALSVTLVGLCTDICVVSNALLIKAFLPETPVQVIAGCCAGVTPESHQAALKTMVQCQIQIL